MTTVPKTIIQYPRFRMATSCGFMLVFIVFNIMWVYWKRRLSSPDAAGDPVGDSVQ